MSFLDALKGRRLFQIVGSAAAAGWAVLEVVDQLASRGVVPEVLYYLTLVWCVGGILVAAVVGWHHGERGKQSVSRAEVMMLGAVATLTIGGTGVVLSRDTGASVPVGAVADARFSPARVVVEYFDDGSTDESLGYLADGLTESLIYELASLPQLDVLSQNASLRYRDSGLEADSLAVTLQAGTLVRGTVEPAGDGLRIEVGMVDGNSGEVLGNRTFETATREIVELKATAVEQVSAFLRERLGEELALRGASQETEVAAAWDDVLRAEAALKTFERAVVEGNVAMLLSARAEADSSLAAAEAADPAWPRPASRRAFLATRMAQLTRDEPLEMIEWLDQGQSHVERALDLDSAWAEALEERGALRYLRWNHGFERDPVAAPQLLADARADLELAVSLDPTRARAYNILSIIASEEPDPVRAKLMARRAYEEDAYLTAADETVYTLYATSYDLEDFSDAVFYCEEGARRFPDSRLFHLCELWLRSAGALEPDVTRAWELANLALASVAPGEVDYRRSEYQIIVGGVIAKAGLPDSARAVMEGARVGAGVDPQRVLLGNEAVFRLQLGDRSEALSLLQEYLTASPEHRVGWQWTTHWWWRDLRDDPAFRALIGAV